MTQDDKDARGCLLAGIASSLLIISIPAAILGLVPAGVPGALFLALMFILGVEMALL